MPIKFIRQLANYQAYTIIHIHLHAISPDKDQHCKPLLSQILWKKITPRTSEKITEYLPWNDDRKKWRADTMNDVEPDRPQYSANNATNENLICCVIC